MNNQSLGSCKPDLSLTVDQAIEKAKSLRDAAYNLRGLEIERRKANNR